MSKRASIFRVLAFLTLALSFAGYSCASSRAATSEARTSAYVYPGASWERVAPEAAGWSVEGLERVRQKLATLPTTGMVAVVGGRVVFEYGDVQRISYLASVRKSVLSMLYGIYHERGAIDLNKTLAELGIDDIGGLSAEEKKATVRNLITARSGIYHEASNPGDNLADAPPRGSQKPGAYYLYSNWDFNALGTIFEKMTGVNIYDALGKDIAEPIGMQDWDRSIQRKSGDLTASEHPAYHINLSTRDMARIAYLMLREGNWNGKQIVPRAWVAESTRAFTRRTEMNPARVREGAFGYGYLWWVFDNPKFSSDYDGAYAGLGAIGQQLLIMPKLDLVIAHKTATDAGGQVSHNQFLEIVALFVEAKR